MTSNVLYLSFSTLYSSSLWRTDSIVFSRLNKPPVSFKTPLSNGFEINKPPPPSRGIIEDLLYLFSLYFWTKSYGVTIRRKPLQFSSTFTWWLHPVLMDLRWSPGEDTQEGFIREGSAPRSDWGPAPFAFIYYFRQTRYPFRIPFNCCKCTVF